MEPTQLLLIPEPRRVKIRGGFVKLDNSPLTVKGINPDFIAIMNACCGSLPGLNPQFNGELFSEYHSELEGTNGNSLSPDILIRAKQDLTPLLPTLSEKQFNFGQEEARAEGYRLTIQDSKNQTETPITIDSETVNGTRHALFTLIQLICQFDKILPSIIIEDAPAFPVRGVMLDVSRDRVPLQSELLNTVDLLASFKINHLELYTEHTFAYQGHKEVWKNSSPLTPTEIRELDKHCVERGITLAANQNCFGHMHRWLKHDTYQPLAEITGDWSFNGFPKSGPFSLCPGDPGSIKLVQDMLDQLTPCFSSGIVNIGCDETYDVGQGRSKSAIDKHGAFKVYWDYVSQVMNIVKRHNARPSFWADMWLGTKSKFREKIPEDSIGLAWGYEPESDFAKWCKSLGAKKRNIWVCPGTSSWRSITGRTKERRVNISRAVSEGVKGGSNGALITDWGDMGHRQQWPVSLNGIVEAAGAFWAGGISDYCEAAISLHAFGDQELSIGKWLNDLGNADSELRGFKGLGDKKSKSRQVKNATCLFVDMEAPLGIEPFKKRVEGWSTVLENLDKLKSSMPKSRNKQLSDELKLSLETAIFACEKAILRRRRNEIFTLKPAKLADNLNEIKIEHKRTWALRSRPGGLDDSCQYYEEILKDLKENG
ncbi:MAG: family 20 glycosylhydrolase [Calditrichaeota bacterium]|nr:family 20 glycosylhydrolase [Calditrichota bacterium]